MSESHYIKLYQSIKRIRKNKEQETSIFVGILISIVVIPLLFVTLGLPTHAIYKGFIEYGWGFIDSINGSLFYMALLSYSIGGAILIYLLSGFLMHIKIMLLLRNLEKFNLFWKNNIEGVQNIDVILDGIQDIHKRIGKIAILNNIVLTKNSRYLFLQKRQAEYFYEILINLRSDLQLRLTEHRSTLEQAKSEVSTHIHGTDELNQASELQRQRLDQQIAQFEELQRVLVKV